MPRRARPPQDRRAARPLLALKPAGPQPCVDMGSLKEYRRKRDFEKTAEPVGTDTRSGRRRNLAFVIQKHAASHLHYDLRLELDGVMKSWAVPKGPSLDPAVRRLAMEVEDHPVAYNTFEGTIPKGEYGGGTVMLWDRGTYAPDEQRPKETADAAVRRGLRDGKLGFTLRGERLHGSFALIRTDRGAKPKWLLIKHRDDAAAPGSDITADVRTSVATGRTLDEIAADGDRVWRSNRQGSRRSTAAHTPRDDAIAPMRATPARALPRAGDWTYEPWRDGTRVLAYVTADAARLLDERGRDVTAQHRDIAAELASLAARAGRSFVIDGEIAADDDSGRTILFAADLLLDGDRVLVDEPWQTRRAALEALFRRRRVTRVRRQDVDRDGARLLREAARRGWPGVVARRADGRYVAGKRSPAVRRLT
jgi:bifunctional non-homologous end joining protein LigD